MEARNRVDVKFCAHGEKFCPLGDKVTSWRKVAGKVDGELKVARRDYVEGVKKPRTCSNYVSLAVVCTS